MDQPLAQLPSRGPASVPAAQPPPPAHQPHPTVPVHETHVISSAQSSGQMSKYHCWSSQVAGAAGMSGAPGMQVPDEAHQPQPVNASWHSPQLVRAKQLAAGQEKKSPAITQPPLQLPALGPSAPPALHVPVAPHQPQPVSAPHSSQSVIGSQSGGIGSPLEPVASSELVPGLDALGSALGSELASPELASCDVVDGPASSS